MYINRPLVMVISILGIVGCSSTLLDTTNSSNSTTQTTPTNNSSSSSSSSTPTDTMTSINSFTKQSYLDAINNARRVGRTCGVYGYYDAVPALSWSNELYKSAFEHTQDMAETNTFNHTGSNTQWDLTAKDLNLGNGSSMKDRINYNGYTNWTHIGENIAAGSSTVDAVIAQWVSSDGHCVNIMSPNFIEVGMAHVLKSGTDYSNYWTQTFGSR